MGNMIPTIIINPKDTIKEISKDKQGDTNLKLEAQRVKDFMGTPEEWQNWKSQSKSAFCSSGYANILDDQEFAMNNEWLNKM